MANGKPTPPLAPFYDTAQPPERGGRHGSRPYDTFVTSTIYLTCLSLLCVSKNVETWYITVGAATCRPPRWRIQPVGLNGITQYTEPNVAAMIHRHSSPGEGLAPLDDSNTNVPRTPALRPVGGRLPPLQWVIPYFGSYHSTTQVEYPYNTSVPSY